MGTIYKFFTNEEDLYKGLILHELAKILKRGIRKGLFKGFDPYLLATALESMTHALQIQYLVDPQYHPFDADLIIKLFFEAIIDQILAFGGFMTIRLYPAGHCNGELNHE